MVYFQKIHIRFIFLIALFTQTACVGAVMSAVNAREVEDRQKLKQWIVQNKADPQCESVPMIAPIIYHDFNRARDLTEELVVVASTCMTGTAGPDIHTVLTPTADGGFIEWEIPEVAGKLFDAANMQGNRNYRLSVKDDLLVATWRDRSGRTEPPLTIYYQPVGGDSRAFAVYDIAYGK